MLSVTCTHNFAEVTPEGVLHRKGATPARFGDIGVIPGNMRDGVWLVQGLGSKEYLESSSHGCGRVMSRGQAKTKLTMESFQDTMKGIAAVITQATLDESPEAYKDSEMVIAAQINKVFNVITRSRPFVNAKG
jgi:tRNA-splicing ligase RtcB